MIPNRACLVAAGMVWIHIIAFVVSGAACFFLLSFREKVLRILVFFFWENKLRRGFRH